MPGMRDAPRMYRALKKVLPKVVGPYLHLQAEGLEHVPDQTPVIIASNHLSFIDSIVMPITVPRPVYYLGKADYFDSWRTRWFFDGVGVVPVKREGSGSGDAALDTGVKILQSGDIVGIYPEGTRSPDGRLYRGKTGPVRMALTAGVPIVPCAVIGTDRAQPQGKYTVQRYPVTVRFGRPLDFARYAEQAADPFALRSATDELMYEIMMLSGQEYVDEYASRVKSGAVTLDQDEAADRTGNGTASDRVVDLTEEPSGASGSRRRAG
jgi:1-acyl-sn-glycerol-3-phosphate acyltransferase